MRTEKHLDKYDKEILFEYLWKTINFFLRNYDNTFHFGWNCRTLLYFLGGIPEEETSISGTIIVIAFIVVYVLFRNLTKPYFTKKMNKS